MWPCRDENNPSDRLQILDQIRFLLLGQGCLKVIVVVIDYVGERRKSSIIFRFLVVRKDASRNAVQVAIVSLAPAVKRVDE
jgi:hypothetical protein